MVKIGGGRKSRKKSSVSVVKNVARSVRNILGNIKSQPSLRVKTTKTRMFRLKMRLMIKIVMKTMHMDNEILDKRIRLFFYELVFCKEAVFRISFIDLVYPLLIF